MANFAVLTGGAVTNVIVADTLEIAELVTKSKCVECTDVNPAGIGWTYDESTGTFINPNAEVTNVEG